MFTMAAKRVINHERQFVTATYVRCRSYNTRIRSALPPDLVATVWNKVKSRQDR